MATDPVTAGPWPFGLSWALLSGAPIHGRASRGGGAVLALHRDGSGGRAGGCRKRGIRQPDSSRGGDMEGPRHAGNAYTGERVNARHDLGTLLSQVTDRAILRLEPSSPDPQPIFCLRFWRHLYESWRSRTMASTSGPYCSSLRAPIPGIPTSAASSVGSVSAMAIKVLSVNTT
jgi:hypothetical protein